MRAVPLRRRVQRLLGSWVALVVAGLLGGWLYGWQVLEGHDRRDRERTVALGALAVDGSYRALVLELRRIASEMRDEPWPDEEALRAQRLRSPFDWRLAVVADDGEVVSARERDPVEDEGSLRELGLARLVEVDGVPAVVLTFSDREVISGRSVRVVGDLLAQGSGVARAVARLQSTVEGSLFLVDDRWRFLLGASGPSALQEIPAGESSYHYEARGPCLGGVGTCVRVQAPLDIVPWHLVLEAPAGGRTAAEARLGIFLGLALLVLVGFGWSLGRALSRSIVEPLTVLGRRAARLEDGDLATPLRASGDLEIVRLGQILEGARQQLAGLVERLRSANDTLEEEVRRRTAESRRLVKRLLEAGEQERRRIARDLHDEIAQLLTVVNLSLDEVGDTPQLARSKALVERVQSEIRQMVFDLRPTVLDDLGLAAALVWYAERDLGARGLEIDVSADETLRFQSNVEVAAFRIYQEVLRNVVRHADATLVTVELYQRTPTEAILTVEDNGCGFDPEVHGRGLGLAGIRERAELSGAVVEIESELGAGTSVVLRLPLEEP